MRVPARSARERDASAPRPARPSGTTPPLAWVRASRVADVVAPASPRVAAYVGWPYVLLEGGPDQALLSRRNSQATPWHSALPEMIFPPDRS